MGVAFSSLWSSLFGSKQLKTCILGLDAAGKTTLLYKMTMGQDLTMTTAPTVGANTEVFTFRNLTFTLWDVGGQTSLRSSWSQYLASTDAVIFVLDSTDRDRISTARQELHRVAADEQVINSPLLLFANKQDVSGCLTPADISDSMQLTSLKNRAWHIQGCSALTGKGVTQGLDWLANQLGAKS